MCQRSLLQVPMKLASLGIEACFVFETDFLQTKKQALLRKQSGVYKVYV